MNAPPPLPRSPVPRSNWVKIGNFWNGAGWQRKATCVISTLDKAELPDRSGIGPQWHISVSRVTPSGQIRASTADVRRALHAFHMRGAEEDNHHPGVARHFWMPVDPAHRVECECKTDEQLVVEPDGYAWTNPKDGACRGCEMAIVSGRPCPLHPQPAGVL